MADGNGGIVRPHSALTAFDVDSESEDERLKRQRMTGDGVAIPSGFDLKAAIRAAVSSQNLAPDVVQHISQECEKLSSKVRRSLNLIGKQELFSKQIGELANGTVPSGVKPFRLAVDVPELDTPIPPEFQSLSLEVPEDCSLRQLKERLHFWHIAASKKIDEHIIGLQVGGLRNDIAKSTFVDAVTAKVQAKSSDLDDLMSKLSLSAFGPAHEDLALSKSRAEELYLSIMQGIAQEQRKLREKDQNVAKSLAKTVDKLRESKPQDLLRATIEESVNGILKSQGLLKKGARKTQVATASAAVNLPHAYTLSAAEQTDRMEEAVQQQDEGAGSRQKAGKGKGKGKGKAQNKTQGFRGAPRAKVKPKAKWQPSRYEAPKGKGKEAKSKGKGKNKGKHRPQSYASRPPKGSQKRKGKGKGGTDV